MWSILFLLNLTFVCLVPGKPEVKHTESDSESEDEEEEENAILITPYKRAKIFEQDFRHWLMSADGKAKSLRCSKQHEMQVQVILRDASEGTYEIKHLFNRKALRDKWMTPYAEEKQPQTITSYLHSLRFFFR